MKIREHLTYANVAATLALAGVIGGGGAYAASQIGSGVIRDNSIRSADLKNRKAVGARDVRRNTLTGKEIRERTLRAAEFAPVVGDQGSCNPTSSVFVECAATSIRLTTRGRLLVIATGEFFSAGPQAAGLTCRISLDGVNVQAGASPGEAANDNTSLSRADGFASTLVTDRLPKGRHHLALRCAQSGAQDGRLGGASIAVLGISG